MPTYDLHQQTLALSFAANMASKHEGTASDIAVYLKQAMGNFLGNPDVQGFIGEWQLVWGPAVWNVLPFVKDHSTNTMAVFYRPDIKTYVCAIAATNAASIFDWLVEDFWVSEKVRWTRTATDAVAWTSAATNFGLSALLALRDPATDSFLPDFLASVADPDATLILTGHSLAGALSPTLALALYGTPEARSAWKDVLVYPTAGASPGNLGFANAFNAQFPAKQTGDKQWQRWNTDLWNELDVVPHAWSPWTLDKLPTLYTSDLNMKAQLLVITLAAIWITGARLDNILDANALYTRINNEALLGSTQQGGTIIGMEHFLTELTYQHVAAYFSLANIEGIQPYYRESQPDPAVPDVNPAALDRAKDLAEELKASGLVAKLGTRILEDML